MPDSIGVNPRARTFSKASYWSLLKPSGSINSSGKTLSDGGLYRVAGSVVADYWRKEYRKPPIVSLNTEVEDCDGITLPVVVS